MGIDTGEQKKKDDSPECPHIFADVFVKYREIKFLQRDSGDRIMIYPRDMLRWQDLKAYKEITGNEISLLEAELIMGIDAIFEGRNDG